MCFSLAMNITSISSKQLYFPCYPWFWVSLNQPIYSRLCNAGFLIRFDWSISFLKFAYLSRVFLGRFWAENHCPVPIWQHCSK